MQNIFTILLISSLTFACNKDNNDNTDPNQNANENPPANVVDVDGNSYSTVKIGNQIWMAENLKTTRYANGDAIPNVTDMTDWNNLTSGAWCHYNNQSSYNNGYGKLYNWYAVDDFRNICPSGWHVASKAEWLVLTNYLGGESVAGGKMKSIGTTHWISPNTGATNESGFNALPGGYRQTNGNFYSIGGTARWWSSLFTAGSFNFSIFADGTYISNNNSEYQRAGFCIRCIKD